jgi:Xaa-Pro dipeptidase
VYCKGIGVRLALPDSSQWPDRFSVAEYERRFASVRENMRAAGLDALIVYAAGHTWQNLFYLSNHRELSTCFLVVPLDSDPVLVPGAFPHLQTTRKCSTVPDIRYGGGPRAFPIIRQVLDERGLLKGRIGLVHGDFGGGAPGMPKTQYDSLLAALPEAEFIDAVPTIQNLRRIKSAEEIDILRLSAKMTDVSLDLVIDAIRPGMTELDIASIIAGGPGFAPSLLVGSTSMLSNPQLVSPSPRPGSRVLQRGDIVMLEFSKGICGYAGQLHATIALGPPSDEFASFHRMADGMYAAIVGKLRAGLHSSEIAAIGKPIDDNGLVAGNPLTHGYALHIEPFWYVSNPGHPIYGAMPSFTFEAGACMTVEPNPALPDGSIGGTAGGMVIVTENGVEELHARARAGLIQV